MASAFSAIEGLEVSEYSYDAALKNLENRLGNKGMIINSHKNKSLNLSPVY